jgi:Mrp family chromosome partitioning ATPase/uncharacterized protein involved in exopolysaccharide biosynthesis
MKGTLGSDASPYNPGRWRVGMKDRTSKTSANEDASLWDQSPNDRQAESDTHPATHVRQLLRGRWHWAILLALALGVAAAALGFYSQPAEYQSVGTVRIEPKPDQLLYHTPEKDTPYRYDAWFQSQMSRITAPNVLRTAMETDTWQQAIEGIDDPPERKDLAEGIEVEPGQGYHVAVTFTTEHEQLAKPAVDAVLQAFELTYHAQGQQEQNRNIRLLEQRQDDLDQRLDQLRDEKDEVAQDLDAAALEERYQFVQDQLQQYEQQLDETEMRISALSGQGGSDTANRSIAELASLDQRMRQLFEQKETIQRRVETKTEALGYGESHETVARDRAALRQIENQIEQYAQRLRDGEVSPSRQQEDGSPVSLPELRERREMLQQRRKQARSRLMDLGQRVEKLRNLNDQIEELEQRRRETSFAIEKRSVENQVNNQVAIASFATPASTANFGSRQKLAFVGGIGGAGVGFALVLALTAFSGRIRHAEEARSGRPTTDMLGVLPSLPSKLNDPEQAQLAAMSVHHMRTMLQISPQHGGSVYAITSPAAGSGKTSLAMALGLSFASTRTRTLLIDCDLDGGGLTRRFKARHQPSLASWLRHQKLLSHDQLTVAQQESNRTGKPLGSILSDQGLVSPEQLQQIEEQRQHFSLGLHQAADGFELSECVVSVADGNLDVLPTDPDHDNATLSPDALHRVVNQARQQYDLVLLDAGPVLGSLEASLAAREADGTLFVVSRGDQKSFCLRSLDALQAVGANVAGIVFNNADEQDMEQSSYTSASASRRSRSRPAQRMISNDRNRRYGPLPAAVATYGAAPKEDNTASMQPAA